MLNSFCHIPKIPHYSSLLPLVLVNVAPRALIAKTKNNQSQGREPGGDDTFRGPTFLPHAYAPMGGSVLEDVA